MKTISLLLFAVFLSTLSFSQELTPLWLSDTVFQKPESALFDSARQVIYISNINGEYLAKDGNGFISTIRTNGEIERLKWVDGLDNPQGMGLVQNKLYVADINTIVEINTNTAEIENRFVIDSARFLNDIATDRNGDLYISDCFGNKIYKLSDGQVSLWLDAGFLAHPNGLYCTKEDVLILNMNDKTAYAVNKQTKQHRPIFSGIDNPDGIVSDGQGGYLVSGAWQGQIFHIGPDGSKQLLLDLGEKKVFTADIEYLVPQKLLIVPTLNKTVIGYHLSLKSSLGQESPKLKGDYLGQALPEVNH